MKSPIVRSLDKAIVHAGLLLGLVACSDPIDPPPVGVHHLEVVTDLPTAGVSGTDAGSFVVRAVAEDGQPLANVVVHFAASTGAGTVSPASSHTGADGTASTALTLGTLPGANQVSAIAPGAVEILSATVTGSTGTVATLTFSSRLLRFGVGTDTIAVGVTSRDQFGNVVPVDPTWLSRNPALLSVASVNGNIATTGVVTRPGETWLVASAGGVTDSVRVAVQDQASTPCTFITDAVTLPVGGVLSFESTGLACVRADALSEFTVVGHYNTPLGTGVVNYGVMATGIVFPDDVFPSLAVAPLRAEPPLERHIEFERALRERERRALAPFIDGARAWHRQQATRPRLTQVSRVGDVAQVNVNPFEFCDLPDLRSARVAALTSGTIILEDLSNPQGGFTDDEYHAFAMTMDTLVMPVDTQAFGAPTDIDGNGRIAILFTRAVNELTPRGSGGGVVLGFFFSRDLLPRTSTAGTCPGSNVAEMFYVLVPDPTGQLSDVRTKDFVQSVTRSAIAHELQHLINSSRRLYVNTRAAPSEETWLNEGLSHVAEELVFYHTSGLGARQNIGAIDLPPGALARDMHDLYMRGNFGRYNTYLRATESNSPFAANDALATRGAAWSFLRYVADRIGATDGDLWRRLANSEATGVVNLDRALEGTGVTALAALRDWSISAITDDAIAGALPPPFLSQPSWNFFTALTYLGLSGGPTVLPLGNGVAIFNPLRAGGTNYTRFAVQPGREALVQVASGGGVPAPGMRLNIIRTR